MRSFTMGTQPPQPVPALVHFLTASMVSLPSPTALQISPFETLSQLQINASSGKLETPAPPSPPEPPRAPRITSSGLGGSTTLFLVVCSNILYCSASPTRIPPNKYFPSGEILTRL